MKFGKCTMYDKVKNRAGNVIIPDYVSRPLMFYEFIDDFSHQFQ